MNTHFDFTDYDNPIKYFIDDSLFWVVEPTRIKLTNVYIQNNWA